MTETGRVDRKLQEALRVLAEKARPGADCPPSVDIWSAVGGELSGARTRELGLHTVACASCAELWRLARQVIIEGAIPDRQVPAAGRRFGAYRWAGLAASVAVLATATVLLIQRPSAPPPALRAPEVQAKLRSLVPEETPLSRTHALLRWQGPEEAIFSLTVTTGDLRPLFQVEDLDTGEFLLPAELLAGLPDDATLLWKVDARTPDGGELSQAFSTPLAGKSLP